MFAHRSILGVIVLLIAAAAGAVAPATAPSTPREALSAYANAIAKGDVQGVVGAYVATTPQEQAVVNAYGTLATAVGKLRTAAENRYGPGGFRAIGFGAIFQEEATRFAEAEEKIEGDTATIWGAGPDKPPIVLVRVEGRWRISAAKTFVRQPQRRAARTLAQAGAFTELADEIAAGKYNLPIDARLAGRQKVLAAYDAVEKQLAATAPATRQ